MENPKTQAIFGTRDKTNNNMKQKTKKVSNMDPTKKSLKIMSRSKY